VVCKKGVKNIKSERAGRMRKIMSDDNINVDELMTKIREEVAKRRVPESQAEPMPNHPVTSVPTFSLNWPQLTAILSQIDLDADVGTKNLPMVRFSRLYRWLARLFGRVVLYMGEVITKPQRRFNRSVLDALRVTVEGLRQYEQGLSERDRRMAVLEQSLMEWGSRIASLEATLNQGFSDRDHRMDGVEQSLRERDNRISGLEATLNQGFSDRDHRMDGLEQSLRERDTRISGLEVTLNQGFSDRDHRMDGLEQSLRERDTRISGLEASLNQGFSDRDHRLDGLEQTLRDRDNRISGLEASLNQGLSDRDHRIDGLEKSAKQELTEQWGRAAALEQTLKDRDNRISGLETSLNQGLSDRDHRIDGLEKNIAYLKNSLILQERRVSLLLDEARKRLPGPFNQKQLQVVANESAHLLDSLYVSFEDQFRGTREEIKGRLRVHLPILENAKAGKEKRPILDLGCGRGEWLELLQEEGLLARGVDINSILVEQCRERGLEVIESEMMTFLHKLPEASLGAVTGFHIIEHLSFEILIKLLDETVRLLKPGGIAIFETPDPHNILVGSCNFYLDPTHNKPLPSSMMKFIAEARGLCRVEIMSLHPFPESYRLSGSDLAERMNEYFYGPQDYAVIGWKV